MFRTLTGKMFPGAPLTRPQITALEVRADEISSEYLELATRVREQYGKREEERRYHDR